MELNWPWIWNAYAFIFVVLLGTLLSVKSQKVSFFFTFIFPLAVTTPSILFLDTFSEFSNPIFAIAKLYTVTLSASMVWLIIKYPENVLFKKLRVLFFGLNILEVMLTEIVKGSYLNSFVGLLLLLTLPEWNSLKLDKTEQRLRWDSSLIWVLSYSFWNVAFSLNHYPNLWFFNTLHVVLALALVLFDAKWYAQIRAVSLNICFSTMIAFWPALRPLSDFSKVYGPFVSQDIHQNVVTTLVYLGLGLAIAAVIEQLHGKKGRLHQLRTVAVGTPKTDSFNWIR